MAAALPDPGWPRGNCPILLPATTVHRSFHHHRLLPGIRPCSTQRKDVLFNPDSPRLLRTLRRGDRCFSGDRFSMSRPRPQGACNRRGQAKPASLLVKESTPGVGEPPWYRRANKNQAIYAKPSERAREGARRALHFPKMKRHKW
jgi:hypothetical protein